MFSKTQTPEAGGLGKIKGLLTQSPTSTKTLRISYPSHLIMLKLSRGWALFSLDVLTQIPHSEKVFLFQYKRRMPQDKCILLCITIHYNTKILSYCLQATCSHGIPVSPSTPLISQEISFHPLSTKEGRGNNTLTQVLLPASLNLQDSQLLLVFSFTPAFLPHACLKTKVGKDNTIRALPPEPIPSHAWPGQQRQREPHLRRG